jgi:uncharacterized protein (DUF1499 family)
MPVKTADKPPKVAATIRQIAIALLLLMPIAALGSRFELWPHTTGLLLFAVSMLGSLLIQIINAIWLLRRPAVTTKSCLRWASLFALPPLLIVATLMRNEGGKAGIHNISTDLIDPPEFVAAIQQRGSNSNPLSYTAETARTQQKFFPEVGPIISDLPPNKAFKRALATAEELSWEIYAQAPDKGHIEALHTTLWFGFKDDIVIRIRANNHGSQIDLRSVSRVGAGDFGTNAKRIVKFTEQFQQ